MAKTGLKRAPAKRRPRKQKAGSRGFAPAECRLDAVPAELREYAGLEREAVIVGMHTFIEIWTPERWSAQRAELDRDGTAFTERLAELI